jgi:ribosomal subunit interface protein
MCFRGLDARPSWRGWAESQLKRLQSLAAIGLARVTLERQHKVKPAFRVFTLLEVPGPNVHAEARDHTLQAALLKVVKDLERQMRRRRSRRADRRKTNLRLGLMPGYGLMRVAGCKA